MENFAEGPPLVRFSTSTVPARQRVAYWKDAVCAAFVELALDCDASMPFHCDLSIRPASAFDLIDVAGSAQAVHRDERLIGSDRDDRLIVMWQRDGTGLAIQDGNESILAPDSLTILDCRRPYTIRFAGPFRQIVAKLPAQALERRIGVAATRTVPPRLASTSGFTRLAARALDEVAGERRPARAAPLANIALDLLALAALDSAQGSPDETRMDALRVTWAKSHVLEHLHDSLLTPSRVAERQGVSLRLLQRHFAEQGESLSGYILEQRLRRSAEALADVRLAERSITTIALSWGFNDPGRFAQAFRRRFGVTPSEHRRGVRDQPA